LVLPFPPAPPSFGQLQVSRKLLQQNQKNDVPPICNHPDRFEQSVSTLKTTRLSGLIAAPFTPFNADYSLNLEVIPAYVKHLLRQKVTGAFVGGSTGEYASMTQEERISLAATWRAASGPALKIIIHVGDNSLRNSCVLARHAESIGADAIAALMREF
jgi:N-acetylneuraminate lyase